MGKILKRFCFPLFFFDMLKLSNLDEKRVRLEIQSCDNTPDKHVGDDRVEKVPLCRHHWFEDRFRFTAQTFNCSIYSRNIFDKSR